jgi:CRISPR type III-A-associated RAMP protein Csm4
MQPALLVKLRPAGPWRFGPSDGGNDRSDTLFRSDRLFSAFTTAAAQLGFADEWLAAAASVRLSSLFPFQGDTRFVIPPATLWPPPTWLVTSPSPVFLAKIRWSEARFIPVPLVESILLGQRILADQWTVDAESGCLLRRDRPSSTPFRPVLRTGAAVDRLTRQSAASHSFAGVEFEPGAGLWFAVAFSDSSISEEWRPRVEGMLRLLCDSGFGGRRTSGWGQTQAPELESGTWPSILFPKLSRASQPSASSSRLHWALSLFSPAEEDRIDWTSGAYSLLERSGATGKRARFVSEGSVLVSENSPLGTKIDVGEERTMYRSGIALTIPLPVVEPKQVELVETPADPEAPEPTPCPSGDTEEAEEITPPEPEPAEPEITEPSPEPIEEPLPIQEETPADAL